MTSELVVYGIASCDTVKRARQWLQAHELDHRFVDFKKTPPTAALLHAWAQRFGWQALLNTRGSTWRRLDAAQQAAVVDADSAVQLLLRSPSAIKRPLVERGGQALLLGFDAAQWSTVLS
jgi:Spx/MgsR family transcriptional regulator